MTITVLQTSFYAVMPVVPFACSSSVLHTAGTTIRVTGASLLFEVQKLSRILQSVSFRKKKYKIE